MIKIPATVDIPKLLKEEGLSAIRMKSMRDKIYYFLSLITRTNDNVKFIYDDGEYKRICSSIQKKIHGNKEYYEMLRILESGKEPIISNNGKWLNKKYAQATDENEIKKGFCLGYKINPKYDTGKTISVRISKKLSKRIIDNSGTEIAKSYRFLTDQFKNNKISIDPRFNDYLINHYKSLKELIKNNKYQTIVLKNFIGRWLECVDRINRKEIWYNVSKENHRLNSTFTSLPRELRKFILINNEPLEMIDIKSSQPYILSSVVNSRYFLDTSNDYNLNTIYPELYLEIKQMINESNKIYHNNSIITNTSPYKQSSARSSLYMWCEFLTQKEVESVVQYSLYQFEKDFYMDIVDNFTADSSAENRTELREKLKGVMMLILFDNNYQNRNNNIYIKLFKKVYPGMNAWIEMIHRRIGKQAFSYVMQRTESYLMLNKACREFHEQHRDAPIFTIHDGLYTTSEYISDLTDITKNNLTTLTKKVPGIKHTIESTSIFPDTTTIHERWMKIKPISGKKKYEEIEHTILDNNLKLADAFIKTLQN